MRLIFLSCAWILGIYLGSTALPLTSVALLASVPSLLLIILRYNKQTVLWTLLCLFALFGGFLCFHQSISPVDERALQFYNDRGVVGLKGVVETDPEMREWATRLQVAIHEVEWGGEWRGVSGSMMVYVRPFPKQCLRDFPYYR